MTRPVLALGALLLAVVACDQLTGGFGDVVALEVHGAPTRRLEEGTTLMLSARALNLAGDSIAAEIRWAVVDTGAGLTVDAASGLVTGVTPGGPWRVQPRVDALVGDPVRVTVAGAPDSLAIVGDTVVTATGTAFSPPMSVRAFDLTTAPGSATSLPGVTVRFLVVEPVGAGLTLRSSVAADSTATADSTIVISGNTGTASAVLRATGTAPDSALVDAVLTTALGGAVTGSPARFVVRFQ